MSNQTPISTVNNGENLMEEDNPGQQPASKPNNTKKKSTTQFKRRSSHQPHKGPKPYHKPKQPISTVVNNDQLFIDASQEGSFPHDPDYSPLENINAEIKHVSGVIHSLIEYHVKKYTQPVYAKDKSAPKKCFHEVRHHIGVVAAAYLRSAKHTTVLPTNITQQLQNYAYHDLYIDGGCAGIINSFMPIQGSCQLNVADVLHRVGLWFDKVDMLHQALNKGQTLKNELLADYNSLLMLSSDNYMIRKLAEVQSVATVYTINNGDLFNTNLFKLDPRIHFTRISQIKVPTFVFEQSTAASSLTKGRIIYTQKVRSIKYASKMDIANHAIRYVGQVPPVLGDVMARVNSSFQFWYGFSTVVQDHQPRMLLDNTMYMNPCTVAQPARHYQHDVPKATPSRVGSPQLSNESAPLIISQPNQPDSTTVLLRAEVANGIAAGVTAYLKVRAPVNQVNALISSGLLKLQGDRIVSAHNSLNYAQLGFDIIETSPARPKDW